MTASNLLPECIKLGQIWQCIGGSQPSWKDSIWVVGEVGPANRSHRLLCLDEFKRKCRQVGDGQYWDSDYFDNETLKFISERDCTKCRKLPQRNAVDGELDKDFMCWSCYER